MSKKSNRAFANAIWLGDWEAAKSTYATGNVDVNQHSGRSDSHSSRSMDVSFRQLVMFRVSLSQWVLMAVSGT